MPKSLATGIALLIAGSAAASAVPSWLPAGPAAPILPVADGCGPAFHRNFRGFCVPNGPRFYGRGPVAPIRLPPPCPRFYHRDPDPARPLCYPNL